MLQTGSATTRLFSAVETEDGAPSSPKFSVAWNIDEIAEWHKFGTHNRYADARLVGTRTRWHVHLVFHVSWDA